MTQKEMRNDITYHAAISVAKNMRRDGLITEEEYVEIDRALLQKYQPYLGLLQSKTLDKYKV